MLKRILPVFLISIFILTVPGFAEDKKASEQPAVAKEQPKSEPQSQAAAQSVPQEEVVKGVIKEIAGDGSYVVINDTKILTTKEFLEDSYLEVGDNVEITAEKTDQGLKAKNYNYIFEEEAPSAISEEVPQDATNDMPQGY